MHLGADLDPQRGVEVGERLVEQQHPRLRRQGPGERDPLLLAAGEGGRAAVAEPGEADHGQGGLDPAPGARAAARSRRSGRRSCGKSAQSWNTMPTRRRSGGTCRPEPATTRPPMRTSPPSSRSRPAMLRSSVVLPQPLGPSSATTDPGSTRRSTSRRTWWSPNCLRAALTTMLWGNATAPAVWSAERSTSICRDTVAAVATGTGPYPPPAGAGGSPPWTCRTRGREPPNATPGRWCARFFGRSSPATLVAARPGASSTWAPATASSPAS